MSAPARRAARRVERVARGAAARRSGRGAEAVAALWLTLTGWRVIGWRVRTPLAEIDLLARRGPVVAAVEVKHRRTLPEALDALRPAQAERLRAAVADLAQRRADLRGLQPRLDLLAMAPGRAPRRVVGL